MGGGRWDVGTYYTTTRSKAAAGKPTFDYSADINAGRVATGVHELLDPSIKAGPTSPHAGKVMREVMITAEHPHPVPIGVVLDVTGSNYEAAVKAHSKLPQLLGILQRKGYVEDPQINFCATGDAYCDAVPLQVGQFESDNRLDDQLAAMYLERGGGGQRCETYELAAYFFARHTYQEPLDKYGKKGYLFFIGDEMPYATLRRQFSGDVWGRGHSIESLIGDTLETDIETKDIFRELQTQYEVFFLFQQQGTYDEREILPMWREPLGERALVLEDPSAVCEFIAGVLGMLEGGRSYDQALQDLRDAGADPNSVRAAGKALAHVESRSPAVRVTGQLPDVHGGPSAGAFRI